MGNLRVMLLLLAVISGLLFAVDVEPDVAAAAFEIPRSEYPRPQFERTDWLCLNGPWEFEIDSTDDGLERGLNKQPLKDKIIVPFCPESKLSGIEHVDFMNVVWYRRVVAIPEEWQGRKVLLHFQAVDYETTVWVNDKEVARHTGCWTGFECDLEGIAEPGKDAVIVVRARDLKAEINSMPRGKQSDGENRGCLYTRTTGIWQTVWMEPVNKIHINRPRITPDLTNRMFHITVPITNSRAGTKLHVTLSDSQGVVAKVAAAADADFSPMVDLTIPANRLHLWEPGSPFLYDLKFELFAAEGTVLDTVKSYAGMRSVTLDGTAFKINGKSIFQRQVLDQGFYPDGIMTAPTDAALKRDITLSMAAGFNSARLHQKVFEERFLYYCDQMGYLVWGEFGNWGIDMERTQATYVSQWLEAVDRDYSHPAIIGWCPLNETNHKISDARSPLRELISGLYAVTKTVDASRPAIDSSGWTHIVPFADVYDCHNYSQDPADFAKAFVDLPQGRAFSNNGDIVPYQGQPYFCSEFGGIKWNPQFGAERNKEASWGYGEAPGTLDEFYARFEALCKVMLDNPDMFGYCYTQLTDVFQEQNGIYYFDRSEKFDMERIRNIQQRPAAIEKKYAK